MRNTVYKGLWCETESYLFSLYYNSDLDDQIFDSLLASMAAVQDDDIRASFLFVGNLKCHHQEWLGSITKKRHGVSAFVIAPVSGCAELVVGPTHVRGGTLDLLMTDVPAPVRVPVEATIGNSDHSSLSAVISMAQVVKNLCVSWKVFLKHPINWNAVCGAIQDLADKVVLNEHLPLLV